MEVSKVESVFNSLPSLYFLFMLIWLFSASLWTFNTYRNHEFQLSKLQWTLAGVPLIKALHLTLSFLFWYSCLYTNVCSLWMSFGVYVTGLVFQTVAFVSFFLISHGYCITCCRLSLSERRSMAALASIFYFTLVGYRASLPYFSVLLLLYYFIFFYMIFHYVSQNLLVLKEQLNFIEDEDVQAMHDAVYAKYIMLKKFKSAMHIVAVLELAILINGDHSPENYWIRLSIREWAQFLIFMYIGWIFRSQELAPRFSVMPIVKYSVKTLIPPIFSVEMDAKTFEEFTSNDWHIGVPTLPPHKGTNLNDSVIVMIQHPRAYGLPHRNFCCRV